MMNAKRYYCPMGKPLEYAEDKAYQREMLGPQELTAFTNVKVARVVCCRALPAQAGDRAAYLPR